MNLIPSFNARQLSDITNVIAQKVDRGIKEEGFYIIAVWFSDIANELRKANCPPNGYHTFIKTDYGDKNLLEHTKKIWDKGLVPIEIVQKQGAVFYALPKKAIDKKTVRLYEIMNAEEEIPSIEDFARVIFFS